MKLIDADALRAKLYAEQWTSEMLYAHARAKAIACAISYLDDAPTVSQITVDHLSADGVRDRMLDEGYVKPVRCKDCVHAGVDGYGRYCIALQGAPVKDDHFCADGERKDDE